MKAQKKIWFVVLILLGLDLFALGQKKFVDLGYRDFENKQYISAINNFNKALKKFDGDTATRNELVFKLAQCYRLINNPCKTETTLQQLIINKYAEEKPEIYLLCANAQVIQGKYAQALTLYDKFLEGAPDNQVALTGKETCLLSSKDTMGAPGWTVKNLMEINSAYDDFAAIFGDSKFRTVIFASNRKGCTGKYIDNWTNGFFSDFFISSKRKGSGEYSTPILLDKDQVINTLAKEGTGVFYSDYKWLLYTRCAKILTGTDYCKIYQSECQDNSWLNSDLVYFDDEGNVGQPAIASDGLTLYFASGQPGGNGGKDIWKTSRSSVGKPFGPAENLGEMINTQGDEMFPSLVDDSILYYASNGRSGYGGLDIYRIILGRNGPSSVEHLPRPFNSSYDDFAISFDNTGEHGFFTSRRSGGKGGDDIYYFEKTVPRKMFIYGSVKDEVTMSPMAKHLVLLIINNRDTLSVFTNDLGNFRYDDISFSNGNKCTLLVENDKYFTRKITFSPGNLKRDTTYRFTITLQQIPERPVILPDIYYEFNKWDLMPQYQDSLMTLVTLLNDNPKISIELASHTDSRGTEQHNDELSQKRAESVVSFLSEKGIEKTRLTAKGYGKRVPRVLSSDISSDGYIFRKGTVLSGEYINSISDEKKREAAHQLNRRTEFSVINQNAR